MRASLLLVTMTVSFAPGGVDGSPKNPDRDKNCSSVYPDPCGTGCDALNPREEILFSDYFGPVTSNTTASVSEPLASIACPCRSCSRVSMAV